MLKNQIEIKEMSSMMRMETFSGTLPLPHLWARCIKGRAILGTQEKLKQVKKP